MGSRKSPMKAKVFMANMREFRIETRELRERSRKYKPTRAERIRIELGRRAHMEPKWRALRAEVCGSVREYASKQR